MTTMQSRPCGVCGLPVEVCDDVNRNIPTKPGQQRRLICREPSITA